MPDGARTRYASKFDGPDRCFRLVKGLADELGYFCLKALQQIRGAIDLPIQRDRFFQPTSLRRLMKTDTL